MFTFDAMIDSVQLSKKKTVETFVTDKKVAETLNKFIDAQTDYTKSACKTANDTVLSLTQHMIKVMQDSTKFDYTKFGEGIMKAYQTNFTKV